MRKLLKLSAFTALLALCVLALASCGACRHKETEWVVEKEATCTVVGREAQKCLKCEEVLNTREVTEDCRYREGVCIYCGEVRYGNAYLSYREITWNGTAGYEIAGRGNCAATELEIPTHHNGKPVLAIAANAFRGDEMITALTVGKNLCEIGAGAFADCVNLASVSFAENAGTSLLGEGAFQGCTALKAFALPAGVTHLPARLFEECTALTDVLLHDGVLSFGEDAFSACEALAYTTLNGMRFLGSEANPTLALMAVDKAVSSLEVPAGVRIIASFAFSGCSALTSLTLPDTLLQIGDNAFAFCRGLSALTLPDSVTEIGAYAFKNCSGLSRITLSAALSHIGNYAFLNTALAEVVLPASLQVLGSCAFSACDSLTSVSFEAQTGWQIGQTMTAGTPVDVSNATANAAALTGANLAYYWYR